MKHSLFILLFVYLSSFCYGQEYIKHEIIVMLKGDVSWKTFQEEIKQINFLNSPEDKTKTTFTDKNDVILKKILSKSMNIGLLQLHSSLEEEKVIDQLYQLSTVRAAQLNYIGKYRKEPDDVFFDKQWYLQKIDAPKAWEITQGGLSANNDTIVALVIDEGFDVDHEDLEDNIWVNVAEIPNNGIDDDHNGYIDDIRGWNLSDNSGVHPQEKHGTQVVGLVGSVGNNATGISGINWAVKIIPISIKERDLNVAKIIDGYNYALELRRKYNNSNGSEGAYVVATNFSAGFRGSFPENLPVLCELYDRLGNQGILSVTAAPNDVDYNVEEKGDVPTLCVSPFLITVTRTDSSDLRTGSFGSLSVDLAAPGNSIFTTKPSGNYGYDNGTSFAAPQVTGAVALLYSFQNDLFGQSLANDPKGTAKLVKDILLRSVDKIDTLTRWTYSGGRLNLYNSLELLNQYYEGWNESFGFVNVYPNPVDNFLTIIYQSPDVNTFDFALFNELGQRMISKKIEVSEIGYKQIDLDLSNYSTGIYFLMLKNETQIKIKKIIVY